MKEKINIKVLAFGIAKDIINGKQMMIDLPEPHTVGSLRSLLYHRYPDFEKLNALAIAVNNEYANDKEAIKVGDEVVLIPPVSGG